MPQINHHTQFNIQLDNTLTWNVEPLLHEIRHALDQLINSNETSAIDLRSIPLAPGEEEKILATLGKGEVQATLDILGPSEVYETHYSGVWIVTHYNDDEQIISRFIEISNLPEILCSQIEDVADAYSQLSDRLERQQT